uniref:Uncharacterized protein n=1 Tax=Petromyzon marinus TaxID=7757 RepID=S4RI97_PETMA
YWRRWQGPKVMRTLAVEVATALPKPRVSSLSSLARASRVREWSKTPSLERSAAPEDVQTRL